VLYGDVAGANDFAVACTISNTGDFAVACTISNTGA
jgi:hypothetical protein